MAKCRAEWTPSEISGQMPKYNESGYHSPCGNTLHSGFYPGATVNTPRTLLASALTRSSVNGGEDMNGLCILSLERDRLGQGLGFFALIAACQFSRYNNKDSTS